MSSTLCLVSGDHLPGCDAVAQAAAQAQAAKPTNPYSSTYQMLFISAQLLRESVSMPAAVAAVRRAFSRVSAGQIEQPTRLVMEAGTALAMLARDRESGTTALKAVTVRPQNRAAGRPAVQALVILFDGATGTPEAVIDGTTLTALRTGAASGVATDLLAPVNARVMAMIGAGGQSADQIRAVCSVRPIAEVRIASLSTTSARGLAERLGPELAHVKLVPVSSNREAISEADVICTATASTSPLFEAGDLRPTVHVNAVGAYKPDMCELPAELLRDARVVAIDEMGAAMAEAGDLLQAMSRGYLEVERLIELGKLLASPPPFAGGWTVFKSVGIAAQDLEVAELAVREVRKSGRAAADAFEIGQS